MRTRVAGGACPAYFRNRTHERQRRTFAVDRFTAAWLSQRIGAEFSARITGVTRFGLFIELDENARTD
jgi:exoribonuclease R